MRGEVLEVEPGPMLRAGPGYPHPAWGLVGPGVPGVACAGWEANRLVGPRGALALPPLPRVFAGSGQARVKVLRKPGAVGLFVLEDQAVFGCFLSWLRRGLSSGGAACLEEKKSLSFSVLKLFVVIQDNTCRGLLGD